MILYLVMSHRNPIQVARLARRLTAGGDAIAVIHHDGDAEPLLPSTDSRIRIVEPRLPVRWGRYALVAAILHCFDWIERERIAYDWLVLLSGQDYPIAPPDELEAFLNASGADAFVDHTPAMAQDARENDDRYGFAYAALPEAVRPIVARLWRLNALQPWIRVVATRAGAFIGIRSDAAFREGLRCYRGSTWGTFSYACVAYIREYIATHPATTRAYAHRLIPDESFMQSILATSGKFRLVNDNLSYIDWPEGHNGSPRTLTNQHFDAMLASGKRFARKFDVDIDPEPLNRLDGLLARAARGVPL